MRVLNTSILALALFSLIGCGQLEKGKKNEKKKPTQKTVVSEEEMAARAEIYKDIPKTTFIRVEIDPETGAEKLDTAEIRHGKELLSSGEPTELAAAFDGAAVAKELEVASDHVSDDFDDVDDASSESFRLVPWALRTPMFRWGYRQGYRKGVYSGASGSPRDAYYGAYDGYTGSPRQMPPVYNYGMYTPNCLYGGYAWNYGPQYVRANGNYRYYAYAAQGAEYYSSGIYGQTVSQPYEYGQGIWGQGAYTGGYASSYGSWCSSTTVVTAGCN